MRTGALLILKVDWAVHVYQLTAAQQAILDHRPHLVTAPPTEIITALESSLPVSHEATLPSGVPQLGAGTAATMAAN